MDLHEDKFEYLAYRTPKSNLLNELPFTCQWLEYTTPSGQHIYPKTLVKDLGVHLSPDLKWASHVNIITDNANKMSNWVMSVFADRSQIVMLTLYKSLIRSKLEYSCPVWNIAQIKRIFNESKEPSEHLQEKSLG